MEAGVKLVMVGAWRPSTVNTVDVAVPLGVVTWMVPVMAVAGTTASTSVALATEMEKGACPLKDTAVAPVRLAPVRTTVAPGLAWVGLILLMEATAAAASGAEGPPPPPQASSVARAPTRRHRISKRFMVAPKNSPHEVKQSADPGGPSSIKGLWRAGIKNPLSAR